ncbi:hypothetical protein SBADM41S_11442 [Streptomyces badius]
MLAERAPDAQRHGGGLGDLGQLGGGGAGLPGIGGRPVELLGRRPLRQQVEEPAQGGRGVLGGACHAGEHTVIASREGPSGQRGEPSRAPWDAVRRAGGRGHQRPRGTESLTVAVRWAGTEWSRPSRVRSRPRVSLATQTVTAVTREARQR